MHTHDRLTSGTLPWTRTCFVCGAENPHGLKLRSRIEGDFVVLEYTTRASDLGYRHMIHGGITMTLLDEVMTWAAIIAARRACVAAEMTTRLKKPVAVGQRIRAEGMVVSRKGRLIMTEGAMRDEAGAVLAAASGKYVPMAGEQIAICAEDFVISPESIHPAALLGCLGAAQE